MRCGIHTVSGQRKVLPDRAETRQKRLCTLWVAKTMHAPLTFRCGLMAMLSPTVQSGSRFHEYALDASELRYLRLGCRIAAQLIRDDLAWRRLNA